MTKKKLHLFIAALCFALYLPVVSAQHSVARKWNEVLLQDIREDFARPPVHARNLFHTGIALYDAWAAYDTMATPYLLGKTVSTYTCPFNGVTIPANAVAAQEQAMSFAMYRILLSRFNFLSPSSVAAAARAAALMAQLGYDINNTSLDYTNGGAAELGNYLGQCIIQMGYTDGANETGNYAPLFYQPVNPPLAMNTPGNPGMLDPNRWQPLKLVTAIDQNGNPIPGIQKFQSPEWGYVAPFALSAADKSVHTRDGHDYPVYLDPGPFPTLDTLTGGGLSEEYKWNFSFVSVWGSHLTPEDTTVWDISPRSIGNNQAYPQSLAEYHTFYNREEGGDISPGRVLNPHTGQPYPPQYVLRGDYTRVLTQFWADGPNSETPPGHWFSILNKVNDNPLLVKKFNGSGPVLSNLEWDVKAYFTLGGAVHDAAVATWSIKGWYDGVRPVSAIRYMADHGQSSDPLLPNYHPAGLPLEPGFVELVLAGDPLAGPTNENLHKIKVYTWRGGGYIGSPINDIAGVGWILAEEWWPYQKATFVTPPFGGYTSGHSAFSRAAAEALTLLTGDAYFPGGVEEYYIAANSGFLGYEKGPSQDVTLQWATYRDASDQCSLSRIWGGIHPPMDDIPSRLIGAKIGIGAFQKARTYFYEDTDGDGQYSFEDCNDGDSTIYAGAPEICDQVDNDCDGLVDDGVAVFTFYADADGDGFGSPAVSTLPSCENLAPAGYVGNNLDCNDAAAAVYPGAAEVCDEMDNDCNGLIDEQLAVNTLFVDSDGDGYGNPDVLPLVTCQLVFPTGYVPNNLDCNDSNPVVYYGAPELPDGLDNNCDGVVDSVVGTHDALFGQLKVYPNPVRDELVVYNAFDANLGVSIINAFGQVVRVEQLQVNQQAATLNVSGLTPGIYFLLFTDRTGKGTTMLKIVKME